MKFSPKKAWQALWGEPAVQSAPAPAVVPPSEAENAIKRRHIVSAMWVQGVCVSLGILVLILFTFFGREDKENEHAVHMREISLQEHSLLYGRPIPSPSRAVPQTQQTQATKQKVALALPATVRSQKHHVPFRRMVPDDFNPDTITFSVYPNGVFLGVAPSCEDADLVAPGVGNTDLNYKRLIREGMAKGWRCLFVFINGSEATTLTLTL